MIGAAPQTPVLQPSATFVSGRSELAHQTAELLAADADGRMAELGWTLPANRLPPGEYAIVIPSTSGETSVTSNVRVEIR